MQALAKETSDVLFCFRLRPLLRPSHTLLAPCPIARRMWLL